MLVREPIKVVDYLAFLTGEFCCKEEVTGCKMSKAFFHLCGL